MRDLWAYIQSQVVKVFVHRLFYRLLIHMIYKQSMVSTAFIGHRIRKIDDRTSRAGPDSELRLKQQMHAYPGL
jgi:hypothetical protein